MTTDHANALRGPLLPRKVQQLRQDARKQGLNPNIWFNHVERVAAKHIGRETVTYVSHVYKYYVVYRLLEGKRLERLRTLSTCCLSR